MPAELGRLRHPHHTEEYARHIQSKTWQIVDFDFRVGKSWFEFNKASNKDLLIFKLRATSLFLDKIPNFKTPSIYTKNLKPLLMISMGLFPH